MGYVLIAGILAILAASGELQNPSPVTIFVGLITSALMVVWFLGNVINLLTPKK